MQAILITSSLLMVLAMLGPLLWLASARERVVPQAVPVEPADDSV